MQKEFLFVYKSFVISLKELLFSVQNAYKQIFLKAWRYVQVEDFHFT